MPGPITTALTVALSLTLAAHRYLEHRALGQLTHIHTDDTLYNKQKYGHILDYDAHSLILHGQPTLILSGEFHYWRLPDKTRWRPILEQYRSAGLNCIRIYFHWGFHSPAPGKYIFDGNRDIDYLLQICEEIGLYVLAAPGPYICAETQAGGFPIWLAAKREIRLRHMKTNLWKEYDAKFMEYCVEYFEQILPILARHQITEKEEGCVIGLQIENEAFQRVFGYPIGLHDDMRVLAKTARDCGMTVPLFTNDGFEQGSFIVKDDPGRRKKEFGIDLYGFDKYVVFTPNSEPTSWVVGRDPSFLEDWDPSTVISELDLMEKKVRSFGHANKRTPIFIPELQGGWFNHYGIQYTYDAIYRFYGDQYTRLMLDTVTSQGCTMLNFYMFYGGTNWGTIGDADVYTSYDYSACIREFGLMSGRLRKLRLGILFLQSFADITTRTDAVDSSKAMTVQSSLDKTICGQRRSRVVGLNGPVELTFIRNFSTSKLDRFELRARPTEKRESANAVRLSCCLAYKASFTALGNYTTINPGIHLILSVTPIYIRGFSGDGKKEIWIAGLAASGPTQMAFKTGLVIQEAGGQNVGAAGVQLSESSEDKTISVLSVPEGAMNAFVVLSSGNSVHQLHILFLDQMTLSTLYCYYDNRHANKKLAQSRGQLNPRNMASSPRIVTWGSYDARYNPQDKTLNVSSTESQDSLHILSFGQDLSLPTTTEPSFFGSGLQLQVLTLKGSQSVILKQQSASLWVAQNRQGIALSEWETRTTDFGSFDWRECSRLSSSSDRFRDVNLDYHFTSGHILYRGTFKTRQQQGRGIVTKSSPVALKVNMRNRIIAFVNGVCIGSHMTYSRQLMMPGAKMGYDPVSFGSHTFLVPSHAIEAAALHREGHPDEDHDQEHEIILVIDSFGLSRQPFVVDDIRNPRGLLSARVSGKDVVQGSEYWEVAGVDVTKLDMAYQSTGFPDEHSQQGWTNAGQKHPQLVPDAGVTWWRTQFEGPPSSFSSPSSASGSEFKSVGANIPLCCKIEGEFSAMIILNDVLVGRYIGSDSPQHDFYLMDGLLHKAGSGKQNELKIMMYGSQAAQEARIRILPWVVEDAQGELGQWSGNAAFEGEGVKEEEVRAGVFWTLQQTFSL
ncbi:glycoside hydrolase superfamily [Gamsiella multidivaricata]|uniref:glycoside hydrolase superfamily n=1 Tax=Gamsiella multidivaricata TaxID=101098 RepID=UPI0022209682|nr:glycoside hydrolase superfamily [Gamsiella multidivaricata]KAG0370842.1 hypothetical protein BGZ54_003564 [Gamsiella multidivaricata]KAI7818686.1 glycoside hydrolase superfamily [Gamsiella multidivaricata]